MGNDVPYYERDGRRYDRITQILDYFAPPELVDWKLRVGKREANRISREALKTGTNVDLAIRADVEGLDRPKLATPEANACYNAFIAWVQDYNVNRQDDLATAATTFNDEMMVAGTPDLIWNGSTLIDLKCASAIRPSYWLQTEFYARSLGLQRKAILLLNKQLGLYEFVQMPISDFHWAATRGAVCLYKFYQSQNKKQKDEDDNVSSSNNECAAQGSSNSDSSTTAE